MRIARGSNLDGFKGFNKVDERKNYKLYRPLIYVTKEEILNYVNKHNIPYVIDKTNSEDTYTRNRFRKYVLPPLKKENKEIHKKFIKLSETLESYDNYIDKIAKQKLTNIYVDKKLNIEKFNQEEIIIKKKIIYNILKQEYKEKIRQIKEVHLTSIIKMLESKKPNLKISLPLNKYFNKTYKKAFITETKQNEKYNLVLKDELKLPNNHIIKIIEDTKEKTNNVIKLDTKEILMPIHVRNRINGDKIAIKGLNGSKKVKDIFINEKIPKNKRDNYPIVTDNKDTILWIPGLKKSKFDASNTENYDIIIKYF